MTPESDTATDVSIKYYDVPLDTYIHPLLNNNENFVNCIQKLIFKLLNLQG